LTPFLQIEILNLPPFLVQVHPKQDDWSSLKEAVGADVLPVEYGGNNGPLQDHIGLLLLC